MFDHGLFPAQCTGPARPEDARAEKNVRVQVLEGQGSLTHHRGKVERVLHQQEEVDIVRLRLGRDERAEDDKACKMSRRTDQVVDTLEPIRNRTTLDRSLAESLEKLPQSSTMDAGWQIAFLIESRQAHQCSRQGWQSVWPGRMTNFTIPMTPMVRLASAIIKRLKPRVKPRARTMERLAAHFVAA
ncbi:MAG TPA: hypothetical protein PKD86_01305 [Gemmatales bacterium]|nr:hypothetical protein [Gemmatales bacterium]HMP57962.1 hypothetical protein [Gemmatales bacterium]